MKSISQLRVVVSLLWVIAGLGVASISRNVSGCDLPVFRYVFEKWPEDTCQLIVFHRGPMSEPEMKLDEMLARRCGDTNIPLNVKVNWADVDHPIDLRQQELWQRLKDKPLPWAVLLYPDSFVPLRPSFLRVLVGQPPLMNGSNAARPNQQGGKSPVEWEGPANADELGRVLDSSVRQEIARRLISGDTAVWLFVGSGDDRHDSVILNQLTNQLMRLEKELKQPVDSASGDVGRVAEPHPPQPFKIVFPVISFRRDDLAESAFLAMLENASVPPLPVGEPHIFVAFGKGRVLEGIQTSPLSPQRVREICEFMTQYCSCIIKEKIQRMSFHVPMAAHWSPVLLPISPQELRVPTMMSPPRIR